MKFKSKLIKFWMSLIIIMGLILCFTAINRCTVKRKVMLADMQFVAQTTFTVYKSLGYEKLIPTTSKDLGHTEVSKRKFVYPEYSRIVTISKLPNKEVCQIDLIVSKGKYKKKFTEIIAKNEK